MATDALTTLQASVTKTATFNGAGVNIPTGTPIQGLVARVIYSAATNASGANSVTFQIDTSDDNASWNAAEFADVTDVVNLTTTAKSGEIYIPFRTKHAWVRLTATFAGAGTVPTITYQGDITLALPD